MSASDEVYAKALQYRDHKVPGFSAEQALAEAEKLFLELGEQGHCKAMHNYAVLQQKKGKYKLALECYSQAGLDASKANIKAMKECGQIKEDLFLVLGNDQSLVGNYGSPIMDVVYGTDFDLSHFKSFGGNATTCDINPCAIPDQKHILADALTFTFAKKYNLKHVLIERLPTANASAGYGGGPTSLNGPAKSGIEGRARMNYFGSVVENLSKAMEPGAFLEIEWDPYTTLWQHTREQSEEYHVVNPFHGFMHSACAYLGIQFMDQQTDASWVPREIQAMILDAGKKFRAEVEFWRSKGAGKSLQEIIDRIRAEAELNTHMMMPLTHNKPALLALVDADILQDPTEKVLAAVKNAVYDYFSPHRLRQQHQLSDGRKGIVYNADTVMQDSLFNMAINSMAVQNNAPYAKRYLESIGFVGMVIERRTNTHNGRKNVWMVTAVKA